MRATEGAYTQRFALTSDEVETHLLVELDLAEVALTVCGEPLELVTPGIVMLPG